MTLSRGRLRPILHLLLGSVLATSSVGGSPAPDPVAIRAGQPPACERTAFVSDAGIGEVEAVDLQSGVVSTVANGLSNPRSLVVIGDGSVLAVAEFDSGEVSAVDLDSGAVDILAPGMSQPAGLAWDAATNSLFISEGGDGDVVRLDLGDGTLLPVASGFSGPRGLALLGATLYVTESSSGELSAVDLPSGDVTVVADGLADPRSVAVDASGTRAFVTESAGGVLTSIDLLDGSRSIIASGLDNPRGLVLEPGGARAFLTEAGGRLTAIDLASGRTQVVSGGLNVPVGVALSCRIHPPACVTDQDCDDRLFCDGQETCDPTTAQCRAGGPVQCDDLNPCTIDFCDEGRRACASLFDDSEAAAGADGVCDTVDDNLGLRGGDGLCGSGDDGAGDGVCGAVDNCPAGFNPGQQDRDGDGTGDVCDRTPCPAGGPDGPIVMSLPDDATALPGASIDIPLGLSDTTSRAVLAADLVVIFNPAVLIAQEVRPGALASGCSVTSNLTQPGQAVISVFCSAPLTGGGPFAYLRLLVVGGSTQGTPLDIVAGTLNEGDPPLCLDGGAFIVRPVADVRGRIRNYRDSLTGAEPGTAPVGGSALALTGDLAENALTGCDGSYGFGSLPVGGSYLVTPAKTGDHNLSVGSFDAALIARHVAGLIQLTPLQKLAADVTGNGTLSSMDSSVIAQFAAGLIGRLPVAIANGSDWAFAPVPRPVPHQLVTQPVSSAAIQGSIAYAPLDGMSDGQDFLAVLYGDVSGNWRPACVNSPAAASDLPSSQIGSTGTAPGARVGEGSVPVRSGRQ